MSRQASIDQKWDHERDYRKHEMTVSEINAELARIEREMLDAAAKGQVACKEAMTIIEELMADLGAPMAKARSDA
jgi:hypothetical protein